MNSSLRYLERKEIDTWKWDRCVSSHANGLIYSNSLVLDHLAVNWNAIIIGDYQAVMPLPWRRKFGITYHFQPAFIQQLGIIGDAPFNIDALLHLVFERVHYGTLLFNFSNVLPACVGQMYHRTNMVLDLSADYDTLAASYLQDAKSNIKKSWRHAPTFAPGADTYEAIGLYKQLYSARIPSLREADFLHLHRLCVLLQETGRVVIRKVLNGMGELLAIALFLKDDQRLYNLISCTTIEGRRLSANYFLMDNLIREFANQSLLLDFEGSNVPGIRRFYEQFGSIDQPYGCLQYNHLPWLLRLIKK